MYLLVDDNKNDEGRLFVLRSYASMQSIHNVIQLSCLNGDLAPHPNARPTGTKIIRCAETGVSLTATIYQEP